MADDIALEPVDLDGVPAEWSLAPGSDPSRVLMFFHGGGYCSGSIVSHRRLVTEAGRAAGMRTLAVGYRLAPEHPFPAAIDDALTAWRHLVAHGIAPGRIAVGGDSAGGGLTLALALLLRDAGQALPGCLWLLSPWTDLTMSGETLASKDAVDPLIHKPYLEELRGRLSAVRHRPPRPARLAAVRRSARPAADADPGRLVRDAARRFHPLRGRRRCGRRAGDAGNLAAHDPRMADVERASRAGPPRAGKRRRIHPPRDVTARQRCGSAAGSAHGIPAARSLVSGRFLR